MSDHPDVPIVPFISSSEYTSEAAVETAAIQTLEGAGYDIKQRKCGDPLVDANWPSKGRGGRRGAPDLLLCPKGARRPLCVWDNKATTVPALEGLEDAKHYIEGLHRALPNEPALPRVAAGFNGKDLLLSYLAPGGKWVPIKVEGRVLKDGFPAARLLRNGLSANGSFNAASGSARRQDLRRVLPQLKTAYRSIPPLASGRTPIDFTVALLTLRLLVEQHPDWGTWAEQASFSPGSASVDHAIGERLEVLANRVSHDRTLSERYGDIFEFKEKGSAVEVSFSFTSVLALIDKGHGHLLKIFSIIDSLPPLTDADFDIFGEVYQIIGDEATKKTLGEFFTGRHIISAVLPVLFERAGFNHSMARISGATIADPACGTGGFLTETLRLVREQHRPSQDDLKKFAKESFYGYDIGHANASRARVNMYFAGDGFSEIKGGFDSLAKYALRTFPAAGFDVVVTNPPYGNSAYGRAEEAFLERIVEVLKPGSGWGLVVMPTGVLENPRSSSTRFDLLRSSAVTDIIALPPHTFAPYTKQRTAVVIFRKRAEEIPVVQGDWEALQDAIGDERINMFIVDNDGYANSDKRYRTDRRDSKGAWLHDDLRAWTDSGGIRRESKLHAALLRGVPPPPSVNEFGNPLGPKYGTFRVRDLADSERGAALLPDIPLRTRISTLILQEYEKRGQNLLAYRTDPSTVLPQPFAAELETLLGSKVLYPDDAHCFVARLADLFDTSRGDQGLTEREIYRHYDDATGVPMYGGGASKPKYFLDRETKRRDGKLITVFDAPAIVVSMDGSSGAMQVISGGSFCANHHARVLHPVSPSLELHWFVQQAEQGLRALASNKSSSATLTLPHLEEFEVEIPPPGIRQAINSMREQLERLRNEFA